MRQRTECTDPITPGPASQEGSHLWPSLSRSDIVVYSVISVVAFFVTIVNVGGNYLIHFIDEVWPLNPSQEMFALFHSWNFGQMGYIYVLNVFNLPIQGWSALLTAFGTPVVVQEVATWTILQAVAGIFFYKIVREYILSPALPELVSVPLATAAAIVSFTNYAFLSYIWWDGLPGLFIEFTFGFIFVYYLLKSLRLYLQTKKLHPLYAIFMIASGSLAFSTNIPFNISMLLMALAMVPFALLLLWPSQPRFETLKRVSYYLVFLIGVIGISSLWWLFPSYLANRVVPQYVGSAQSITGNLIIFRQSTAPVNLLSVMRGYYIPHIQWPTSPYSPIDNYMFSSVGAILSYVVMVLMIAAIVVSVLWFYAGRKYLYFAGLTFLVSFFLLGVNSPIVSLIYIMFKEPILLQALRNPAAALLFVFQEFLILSMVLAVEILILWTNRTLGTRSWLFARITPKFVRASGAWKRIIPPFRRNPVLIAARKAGTIALVFLVVWLPFFSLSTPIYTGDAIPRAPFQARAVIPQYIYDTADYLNANNVSSHYALLYPGGFLIQNWTNGFDSYDVLPMLLRNQMVIDSPLTYLMYYIYQSIKHGSTMYTSNFTTTLESLNIKFIVVEGLVGQTPLWLWTQAPDYPVILNSLNNTEGLHLASVIGHNYIYETDQTPSAFYTPEHLVYSPNIVSEPAVPFINMTESFYNLSLMNSNYAPAHNFYPTWQNDGISISLDNATRYYINSTPLSAPLSNTPPPTYYNGIPLSINTTTYPYLLLNFSTNLNAAISVTLVTTPQLTGLTSTELQSYLYTVEAYTNIGYGDQKLNPYYGAGHYTSPGKYTTMIVNMQSALDRSVSKTVNYIFIQFFPVSGNGTGLPGVPITQWPGYQNLRISSIELGYNYFLPFNEKTSVLPVPTSPSLNLLSEFYNLSLMNSNYAPAHNFYPTWQNDGISISLDNATRYYINSTPLSAPLSNTPPPTYYNGIPLSINTTTYPYLLLNFSTNLNAAISVTLVTTPQLTGLTSTELQSYLYTVEAYTNIGYGDQKLNPYYGAGHYTSPGKYTTMIVNMQSALDRSVSKTVNYIFIQFFPVSGNGTGLPGVPITQWPGYQNLSISGMSVGSIYARGDSIISQNSSLFAQPPSIRANTPTFGLTTETHLPAVATGVQVAYRATSTQGFEVSLTNIKNPDLPVLVVFAQNFAYNHWSLTKTEGISNWTQVQIDGTIIGLLVYPAANATGASFVLSNTLQAEFTAGMALAFVALFAPIAVLLLFYFRRRDEWRGSGTKVLYRSHPAFWARPRASEQRKVYRPIKHDLERSPESDRSR